MNPNLDSRDLADLTPAFRTQVETVLAACKARDVVMRPFFTARGPLTQARLWCQSRTAAQIAAQKAQLIAAGAPFLAGFLKVEYAATGKEVTKALPGQSWHQWGEAVDCFVVGEDGEAVWDSKHPGYKVYAEEARKIGLDAGAYWVKLKDTVHIQARKDASPGSAGMTWAELDRQMKARYS